jgi:PAP2 superfamily
MATRCYCRITATTVLAFIFSFGSMVWGQGFPRGHRTALGQLALQQRVSIDAVRRWNEIALNANALDHTPVTPGENREDFREQLGPLRTARAFAIVHIAIFDAVNAIAGGYRSYSGLSPTRTGTSMDAAVAQAAHDTLVALFPSQTLNFNELLAEDLGKIGNTRAKTDGVDLGRQAAAAILALRASDGSQHDEQFVGSEYITSDEPGKWRQDPISEIPLALGSLWTEMMKPFALRSADQFPAPTPPDLNNAAYRAAFDEVKRLGGCGNDPAGCVGGIATPTDRTAEQTEIGIYWGYDGTPSLGTPPRLYNQIATQIAEQKGSDAVELARLLALVNVAMADAGLVCWQAKYSHKYWRPITAIREADTDGNPATAGNPNFTPLGAPCSNCPIETPNFTPPFPAYTSGHATFGAALFETLRKFYRTDRIAFTFVSDEFNGLTLDNMGNVRPLIPRSFSTLSEAEEENGQSRIYLGIHWAFDKTEGIAQGRKVADYVFDRIFTPLHSSRR